MNEKEIRMKEKEIRMKEIRVKEIRMKKVNNKVKKTIMTITMNIFLVKMKKFVSKD
jgi:hypothetical protein